MRSSVAAVLVGLASAGLVAGCGESDVERRAKEANDAVDTTAAQAEADAKKLAEENAKLAKEDEAARKGLAKDVVDAVGGSAEEAQRMAEERAKDAQKAAKDAADGVIEDAQKEADKVRKQVEEVRDDAAEDLQDALGSTP